MNRKEYNLLVESWRRFLIEGDQSGESNFKNKFLILNDGKSGGKSAVLIGVSHDKNESIERDIPDEVKAAAEIGYYFEGAGDDVGKVKNLFGGKLGEELGQWDTYDDIKKRGIKDWEWCYTLFTGGGWNNVEWPQQVYGEIKSDGSIEKKKLLSFQQAKEKTSADVIKLMLTSKEFGPEGLNGLTDKEADYVISLINPVIDIKDMHVGRREEFTDIIDSIYKCDLFFPGGGDKEGSIAGKVNNARRNNLLDKLKVNGGIGIIGYSHLAHMQNLGEIV
tara:strand:- start:443 stop:1273 length:831 start_codon:yes stop_codon:yes gene_type:complete